VRSGVPARAFFPEITGVPRHEGDDLLAKLSQFHPEVLNDREPNAITLTDQAEQEMLRPDVAVIKLQCFAKGKL
jgi:hypothetical protein